MRNLFRYPKAVTVTPVMAPPPPTHLAAEHEADHYVSFQAARLRYRDAGAGPPVVFVHGWTLDLEMWNSQAAALSGKFRVIRYDRRGFGLSTGNPSSDRDYDDLQALCRHLQLGHFALVGMSQGVRPVLRLASSAPASVSCIVLDGPPGLEAAVDDVALPAYRQLVRTEGMGAFRREWAAHPLMQLMTADACAHKSLASILERYPGKDLVNSQPDPDSSASPFRPESVPMPAMVIGGDCDMASRVLAADQLAARLPHAEREVIPAAGHLSNFDNPALYNHLLGAFLARHCNPAHETRRRIS